MRTNVFIPHTLIFTVVCLFPKNEFFSACWTNLNITPNDKAYLASWFPLAVCCLKHPTTFIFHLRLNASYFKLESSHIGWCIVEISNIGCEWRQITNYCVSYTPVRLMSILSFPFSINTSCNCVATIRASCSLFQQSHQIQYHQVVCIAIYSA